MCGCQEKNDNERTRNGCGNARNVRNDPDVIRIPLAPGQTLSGEVIGTWTGPCWLRLSGTDAAIVAEVRRTRSDPRGQPVMTAELLRAGFAGGRGHAYVEAGETVSLAVSATALSTHATQPGTGLFGVGTPSPTVLVERFRERPPLAVGIPAPKTVGSAGNTQRWYPPYDSLAAVVHASGPGYATVLDHTGTVLSTVAVSGPTRIYLGDPWLSVQYTSSANDPVAVAVSWEVSDGS